jgi:hypothetical protein
MNNTSGFFFLLCFCAKVYFHNEQNIHTKRTHEVKKALIWHVGFGSDYREPERPFHALKDSIDQGRRQ